MSYRLTLILTAIIGTSMTFAFNNITSLTNWVQGTDTVELGDIITADWYSQVSDALSCPEGQVFTGFDDVGDVTCSDSVGGGGGGEKLILLDTPIDLYNDDSDGWNFESPVDISDVYPSLPSDVSMIYVSGRSFSCGALFEHEIEIGSSEASKQPLVRAEVDNGGGDDWDTNNTFVALNNNQEIFIDAGLTSSNTWNCGSSGNRYVKLLGYVESNSSQANSTSLPTCTSGQTLEFDGSDWVCGNGGGVTSSNPPLIFTINTDQTTDYSCIDDIDLEDYCGDADGCRIRVVMNHKTQVSDQVRIIDENIYMEQPGFSSNTAPTTLFGFTRQSGGGENNWINGTGTRTDVIFSPWNWAWMYNFKSTHCTGSGHQPYSPNEPYKFTFMTHPAVRAQFFVYDN